jgi:hypothetical protein
MVGFKKVRRWLKNKKFFLPILLTYKSLRALKRTKNIFDLPWYFRDLFVFSRLSRKNKRLVFNLADIYPCLNDRASYTPIEPIYFYQDAWAARKIFELKPKFLVDIASSVKTMSIISQYLPVLFVDIRPPERVKLKNLTFIRASATELPFKNNSIECISSLCVLEHIGLGRYGDKLDPFGTEKAIEEINRITKNGGFAIVSVPVYRENVVFFNNHRTFTRSYIIELFHSFDLLEEKYI